MPIPHLASPDLPEMMTWTAYEALPEEIAQYIELQDGRPVWIADEIIAHRSTDEHQVYSHNFVQALRTITRHITAKSLGPCWRATGESNIFFNQDRSSFVTPDFMAFRCLDDEFDWIYAQDVVLVGEVLSPANTQVKIEEKKARYAAGGIPWYWEVVIGHGPRRIEKVRAYTRAVGAPPLPAGVTLLHPANYYQVDEWAPETHDAIETIHPFPIRIPWDDLVY
ncbi:Uma2 family endonuclease [Nocardia sp. GAS34]|uniref:Uma2 family endonuclease n=1 Tax=unclassified Nocardia TaxID=2637762 RepID=UPI003D21D239